jgi:hypothetical protein
MRRTLGVVLSIAALMLTACGGSERTYSQGRTAACLEREGFLVRYGPRPTELTVYAKRVELPQLTGRRGVFRRRGGDLRLGAFRFYSSTADADHALESSPRQLKDTFDNVFAYGWYLSSADALDCLTTESD